MCPPTVFHIDGLDTNVQRLLFLVSKRRDFGYGASPGGRAFYVHDAMREGLVENVGYYSKSGHVKFKLTPCGRRVAKYLVDQASQVNHQLINATYNSGTCPLEEPPEKPDFDITNMGYHDYEHWNDNPYQPNPHHRTPFRHNPRKSQKFHLRNTIKQRICDWIDHRITLQKPVTYRLVSRLIGEYSARIGIKSVEAIADFQECGIDRIIIQGPTSSFFPGRDSDYRETALWFWGRRDFLPNPNKNLRELEEFF